MTPAEMIAVNLHPRVWFSCVWSEDGRPDGLDEWADEQIDTFAEMVGKAHPAVISQAIGRPLREVWWLEHSVVSDSPDVFLVDVSKSVPPATFRDGDNETGF